MAGRYNFNIPGRPDASIVNQGRITATSGGFAALVAPGVRNSGTITATLGTVALASSGAGFTLDLYGDKLITLAVNDQVASSRCRDRPAAVIARHQRWQDQSQRRASRAHRRRRARRRRFRHQHHRRDQGQLDRPPHGMIVLSAATGGSKPTGAPTQTSRSQARCRRRASRRAGKGARFL
jgi:hypothetical protein